MPYGQGWLDRYGDQEISQFRGAQLMAEKWGLKRLDLEEFALASHQRALAAIDAGYFEGQIAPLADVSVDEGPRRDTSLEKMSGLKPLREGWDITAAVASQISDGAAAVLVASEDAVSRYGLTPLAHRSPHRADDKCLCHPLLLFRTERKSYSPVTLRLLARTDDP